MALMTHFQINFYWIKITVQSAKSCGTLHICNKHRHDVIALKNRYLSTVIAYCIYFSLSKQV